MANSGGNPKILGQRIFVDTWSSTIIGVLQSGFDLFGTGIPEIYELTDSPTRPSPALRMYDGSMESESSDAAFASTKSRPR